MRQTLLVLFVCLLVLGTSCSSSTDSSKATEGNKTTMEAPTPSQNDVPVADGPDTYIPPKEQVDNDNLVTAKVDKVSGTKITITYTNKTNKEVTYGAFYRLQLLKNDKWTEVSLLPNVAFDDIALGVAAKKSTSESVELKYSYGQLSAGHYKIIKEMSNETTKFDVVAEFDIK